LHSIDVSQLGLSPVVQSLIYQQSSLRGSDLRWQGLSYVSSGSDITRQRQYQL